MKILNFIKTKPKFYLILFRFWLVLNGLFILYFITYHNDKIKSLFDNYINLNLLILFLIYNFIIVLLFSAAIMIDIQQRNKQEIKELKSKKQLLSHSKKLVSLKIKKIIHILYVTSIIAWFLLYYVGRGNSFIEFGSDLYIVVTRTLMAILSINIISSFILKAKYPEESQQAKIEQLSQRMVMQEKYKWAPLLLSF